jgi:hypothetical protein
MFFYLNVETRITSWKLPVVDDIEEPASDDIVATSAVAVGSKPNSGDESSGLFPSNDDHSQDELSAADKPKEADDEVIQDERKPSAVEKTNVVPTLTPEEIADRAMQAIYGDLPEFVGGATLQPMEQPFSEPADSPLADPAERAAFVAKESERMLKEYKDAFGEDSDEDEGDRSPVKTRSTRSASTKQKLAATKVVPPSKKKKSTGPPEKKVRVQQKRLVGVGAKTINQMKDRTVAHVASAVAASVANLQKMTTYDTETKRKNLPYSDTLLITFDKIVEVPVEAEEGEKEREKPLWLVLASSEASRIQYGKRLVLLGTAMQLPLPSDAPARRVATAAAAATTKKKANATVSKAAAAKNKTTKTVKKAAAAKLAALPAETAAATRPPPPRDEDFVLKYLNSAEDQLDLVYGPGSAEELLKKRKRYKTE